jgi:hypothetical protein
VSYQQDVWLALLSQAKFAYNNTVHASTDISPFFANYGFHPRFSLEIPGDWVYKQTPRLKKGPRGLDRFNMTLWQSSS